MFLFLINETKIKSCTQGRKRNQTKTDMFPYDEMGGENGGGVLNSVSLNCKTNLIY